MATDPKNELAALSADLRHEVERSKKRGRKATYSDSLRARLDGNVVEEIPETAAQAASPPPAGDWTGGTPVAAPVTSPLTDGKDRGKKLSLIQPEPESEDYGKRMGTLAGLAEKASSCTLCGLCETRNKVVFSRGSARNRVMFIGEAPGADEDRLGEPFVGRAGKLLDQILDAAGFQREEIYVANILKCRPPKNRDPKPEEISACTPYLTEQIELVNPKIICALGKFAGQFLTGNPKAPIGRLRGKIHYYQELIMVLPTYHPAALLRNPNLKRVVWEDMQLLRTEYLR